MADQRRLSTGDWIVFAGTETQIVAFDSAPHRQEVAVLLRDRSGETRMVLVSALYADLSAADAGRPSPNIAPIEGLVTLTADATSGDNYLGSPIHPNDEEAWNALQKAPTTIPGKRVHVEAREDVRAMLETLPQKARDTALKHEGHILELLTGYKSGTPDEALPGEPKPWFQSEGEHKTEMVAAVAAEAKVSISTIARWEAAYLREGVWGLVHNNAKKHHDPLAGLNDRLIDAIIEQAEAQHEDSDAGYSQFYRRLAVRLQQPYYDGVILPAPNTLRPKVKILLANKGTFATAKARRSIAAKPTGTHSPMRAHRPGQVVLVDSTRLDVRAYDPGTNENLSVELLLAIDVCTRAIVAARLVAVTATATDAALLLSDMMRPEAMREHWQENLAIALQQLPEGALIDHDNRFDGAAAKPVIYPETIVIDHGKIFKGKAFSGACTDFGINLQPARVRKGTDKAKVERVFGTIKSDFTQHIAGFTGADPSKRGATTEKRARWTIEELSEFLAYYIVAIYQKSPHEGLAIHQGKHRTLSPNEAYIAAVKRYGWVPAPVSDTMYYDLLPIHWAIIQDYGVNMRHRVYDDPILREYRGVPPIYSSPFTARGRRDGARHGERRQGYQVPFRYDQRDLSQIYFFAWKERCWYSLRWTAAAEHLEPFTEIYLKQVRKVLRRQGRDDTDQREVAQALLALQTDMDAQESWQRTTKKQRAILSERVRTAKRDQSIAVPAKSSAEPPAPAATEPTVVQDVETHNDQRHRLRPVAEVIPFPLRIVEGL